jgi:glycosyltransferase involved in cell wall biosynthesis/MoaA/NifB/PqqE/SkfB family radical SAM enzyme
MRVLKVIHGYPPTYSAGSEVYSQTLCHELSRQGHDVLVFTREDLSGEADVTVRDEADALLPAVRVRHVNMANHKDRYVHRPLDDVFEKTLAEFRPDVVHFGHLNHLSMRLPVIASGKGLPCVFTIHDFWMMCPRGQFIQMENGANGETWPLCAGQASDKCADRCYQRYCSGNAETQMKETAYWKEWVDERMKQSAQATHCFDTMIAPSRQIMERFRRDWPAARSKVHFLDYGFDLRRLTGRARTAGEPFTFGYIGTHTPAKGIGLLIKAFAGLAGKPKLRIWGHPNGQETVALKRQLSSYGPDTLGRVEWLGGYRNDAIVTEVFNQADCIVAPSIWMENSPLVIHEAQQARVPVITANAGGMGEFVQDGINGLTFAHRDVSSLAEAMQRALDDPKKTAELGRRGYLYSDTGDIPEIGAHAKDVVAIYEHAADRRRALAIQTLPSPWRITFDTNPDDCNLRCIMCEDHSPYSKSQEKRRAAGLPKRRMDVALIRKIIEEQAPLGLREIIPSTMGEPLLYEDFDEIIRLCSQHGIKMNLTTNGTFPKRGAETWAQLLVPVCSDVKISWNGGCKSTQEKIMRGADWDQNLSNLRTFLSVRDEQRSAGRPACRVTLQLTFMEANLEELPAIVELASSLGVERVKGHHLWAHFNEIKPLGLKRSADSITRWNSIAHRCRAAAGAALTNKGLPLVLENFEDLEVRAASSEEQHRAGPCPFLGREAWVNAEGRFDPCCCPDQLRRSLGDFGNVSGGLQPVWSGDAYAKLLTNYHNRQVCRTCNMRRLS